MTTVKERVERFKQSNWQGAIASILLGVFVAAPIFFYLGTQYIEKAEENYQEEIN